jgi:hypothetical protein
MEVSGQPHVPPASPPEKEPTLKYHSDISLDELRITIGMPSGGDANPGSQEYKIGVLTLHSEVWSLNCSLKKRLNLLVAYKELFLTVIIFPILLIRTRDNVSQKWYMHKGKVIPVLN